MKISSLRLSKLSMWLVEHKQTHISLLLSHFYPSFAATQNRKHTTLSSCIFLQEHNFCKNLSKTLEQPSFLHPPSTIWKLFVALNPSWNCIFPLCFHLSSTMEKSWFIQLHASLSSHTSPSTIPRPKEHLFLAKGSKTTLHHQLASSLVFFLNPSLC